MEGHVTLRTIEISLWYGAVFALNAEAEETNVTMATMYLSKWNVLVYQARGDKKNGVDLNNYKHPKKIAQQE